MIAARSIPALLSTLALLCSHALAATYTVDNTGDTGDAGLNGVCDDGGGNCTFRAALEEANNDVAADIINFSIAGGGPHVIQPTLNNPFTVTQPVTINGFSQSGSVQASGSTAATLKIALDGVNVGEHDGLDITSDNCTISGLAVYDFAQAVQGGDHGIKITGDSNTIQGCHVGTDIGATADNGNGTAGVWISGDSNLIGGDTPAERNIISGNDGCGVNLVSGTLNVVSGNYVGTDGAGTAAIANTVTGVRFFDDSNTVGGLTVGERNIISGNAANGVDFFPGSSNTVVGNYIGTDVTGLVDLGNTSAGVYASAGSATNTIGGSTTAHRNVISGNNGNGVLIDGAGTDGNIVQGNYIGVDVNCAAGIPNGNAGVGAGVAIDFAADDNVIGGTASGEGNTIAFNEDQGVVVFEGVGNEISGNSIHSNTGIGIDLNGDGVTGNDVGDAVTGDANGLQNFPVVTSAVPGQSTVIDGSLNSVAATTFRLEFFESSVCDGTGNGEGETFLGSGNVTTDGGGDVTFSITVAPNATVGNFLTATATRLGGSTHTSEFSSCIAVIPTFGDYTLIMLAVAMMALLLWYFR